MQVGNLVLKRGAYKHDGIRGAGGGPIPAQNNKGSDKWFFDYDKDHFKAEEINNE